jgi:hypothetical protein
MSDEKFSVKTRGSVGRGATLFFVPLIAYILGLLPVIFLFFFLIGLVPFSGAVFNIILAVILVLCFIVFILFEVFVPGLFIKALGLKIEEGEYDVSLKDDAFFHHLLFFALYRPSLSLVGVFPIVPLRMAFLKLTGLRIGKGSMVAGTELIDEPFAVTIGDHSLIGGYTMIYTHLSFQKMAHKKVRIGNNCFIGNRSVIFPGVEIQDDVIVRPGSVVPQGMVLEKGGIYEGNPARRTN